MTANAKEASLLPLAEVLAKASAALAKDCELQRFEVQLTCARLIVTCPNTKRMGYCSVYHDGSAVIQWTQTTVYRRLPTVTECRYEDLADHNPRFPSEIESQYHLGPDWI